MIPMLVDSADLKHPHALARRLARKLNLAEPGHFILTVAGFGSAGTELAPLVTALVV